MAKADTSTRSPRGAKPVSRAFLAAIEEIPEAMQATVAKAALAMIRDEMKTRKERAKIVAARAKTRAATAARSARTAAPAKAPARAAAAKPAASRAANGKAAESPAERPAARGAKPAARGAAKETAAPAASRARKTGKAATGKAAVAKPEAAAPDVAKRAAAKPARGRSKAPAPSEVQDDIVHEEPAAIEAQAPEETEMPAPRRARRAKAEPDVAS
jgi:hypothetical protein